MSVEPVVIATRGPFWDGMAVFGQPLTPAILNLEEEFGGTGNIHALAAAKITFMTES